MNKTWHSLENIFVIAALVFFSRVLDFESLSVPAEGLTKSATLVSENPLAPFLSLMQHSIFLIVSGLLFLRGNQTIQTLRRGKVIWLLLAVAFLSFIWSSIPDTTFRGAFALMESCAFGLYFASNYNLQQQLRLLSIALGITSLVSLLYTMVFPSYGIEDGIHQGAWRGPYIQKNILARISIFSCLTYISLDTKQVWHKYLIFGGLALSLGLTVLSQSKTALVVLMLLLILSLIYKSFRHKDLIAIPLVSTLLLFLSTIVLALVSNAETILSSMGKDFTLSGRTTIWASLIEQIKLRPWLGYGYMGFWPTEEAKSIMTKLFGTTYVPSHSHNGYLELVTSFGLIGAVLFTLTFIAIARRAIILMRWNKTSEGLWPLLFLSFLIIYNFSEPTLIEHNSIFWIMYLTLALSHFIDLEKLQFYLPK
jgi:O-antigen ligase